jgi:hypothetical protein
MHKWFSACIYVNAAIAVALGLWFFIVPAGQLVWLVHDPGLRTGQASRFAFRWHRVLSPRYERWARDRVRSGKAARLSTADIAGTEWPLFGSVFYLWATEGLQEAWEEDSGLCHVPPKQYARGAIEAAAALVTDPDHAGWVKQHWGDSYLERENLFYRMLLISALTSYQRLLDDKKYEELLRWQVESLAEELDESPYGLLDDYPGQCYPVDIVPAIAAIRRADAVLGTDHSEFVARAIRGFQDERLDQHTGLPAYVVDSKRGRAEDSARGVGLSFMLIWAPQLWPETAEDWYAKYEAQFWQEGPVFAGFREFPRGTDVGWFNMSDVDAGPIIGGYGVAASAFGVGAARTMGQMDHARKLTAEALVASWPLPDGTLLMPRVLSMISDAPYLGESATLLALTRRPMVPTQAATGWRLPMMVYAGICVLLGLGVYEIAATIRKVRRWRRGDPRRHVPRPRLQIGAWLFLLGAAALLALVLSVGLALVCVLAALTLPWQHACPARKAAP